MEEESSTIGSKNLRYEIRNYASYGLEFGK